MLNKKIYMKLSWLNSTDYPKQQNLDAGNHINEWNMPLSCNDCVYIYSARLYIWHLFDHLPQ